MWDGFTESWFYVFLKLDFFLFLTLDGGAIIAETSEKNQHLNSRISSQTLGKRNLNEYNFWLNSYISNDLLGCYTKCPICVIIWNRMFVKISNALLPFLILLEGIRNHANIRSRNLKQNLNFKLERERERGDGKFEVGQNWTSCYIVKRLAILKLNSFPFECSCII